MAEAWKHVRPLCSLEVNKLPQDTFYFTLPQQAVAFTKQMAPTLHVYHQFSHQHCTLNLLHYDLTIS